MKYRIVLIGFLLYGASCAAQITGIVYGLNEDGRKEALTGANLFWKGTDVGAITDQSGSYSIEKPANSTTLIASFIGYEAESRIIISKTGTIDFTLKPSGTELGEVDVVGRVDETAVDLKSSSLTFNIDDKELRKAACCNLSESFETNASVDISFADAVTGTRQIEMLGLAGKYALIQRENIPFARGMNANTGLTFIPGAYVESLQLTKGLSSVLNGYESITGQINIEFIKPESGPRLLLNLYGNQGGRTEVNAISSFEVNEKVSSALLVHGSIMPLANDVNNDGFVDMPLGNALNVMNRWHYEGTNGWEGQWGISYVLDNRKGGQTDFVNEANPQSNLWGYDSKNQRAEFYGKTGYLFKGDKEQSIGFIYNLSYQDRKAEFGGRDYFGSQGGAYINTIFQSNVKNEKHIYRTGLSLLAEDVVERLDSNANGTSLYNHKRNEIVPGAYIEYTFEPSTKFTLVAGTRADYNSYFEELYITPRINARYMLSEHTTFRLGGGRGQRTPNLLNESLSVLASSRTLFFNSTNNGQILAPEIAWNTGASITQDIHIGKKEVDLTVDAFYTWFDNKLVTDLDVDPTQAYFINSQGSRSFSLLTQVDYEVIKNLDMRLAYKYLDAQEQFVGGLSQSYQIPKHRAFANFAYLTESQWKFDATINWFGAKRLPVTLNSPSEFQRDEDSPDFFTVNMQIDKGFKNGLELYIGVENLLNFRQIDPIVNAQNPNSPYFDTNFTWGPIFGRIIYAGLYYRLEKKKK